MTRSGDVIVVRRNSLYSVGVVLDDGGKQHAPQVFGFADARRFAQNWAAETGGRVLLEGADGTLMEMWYGLKPVDVTPLNTSTKLAFRCGSCGHDGHFALNPIDTNDDGEAIPPEQLADHVCPNCGESFTSD